MPEPKHSKKAPESRQEWRTVKEESQQQRSGRKQENQAQGHGEQRGTQAEARRAHEEHGSGGERKGKINLNQAEESQLEQLIMMGSHRAKALIEHRPFNRWVDVEKVPFQGND